jgi:integrase
MAEAILAEILDDARIPPTPPPAPVELEAIPTFGEAVELWLDYLRVEKQRKSSSLRDARNVANQRLIPRFGYHTPLYCVERHEAMVEIAGRKQWQLREERVDTFTTEDVDEFRRELLDSELAPRTVQKILVLLHGVFKLAKRRKLISANPSADAERVTVVDDGAFNILEPPEFEVVYRAALGEFDSRPKEEREPDAVDELTVFERRIYATALAGKFYAGLRMGETLDIQWHCIDFDNELIRVESNFVQGARTTPKGKRTRSAPLVPVLSRRLAELSTTSSFTGDSDYVFASLTGERASDRRLRAVFYAALTRSGLGHKRDVVDRRGNPQEPITPHDLRHSYCTWAVNVWPVTRVQEFAGHSDIQTTMRYVHHQTKADDAKLGGAYLDRTLGAGEPVSRST